MSTPTRTVFDVVVAHPDVANASTYCVITMPASEEPDRVVMNAAPRDVLHLLFLAWLTALQTENPNTSLETVMETLTHLTLHAMVEALRDYAHDTPSEGDAP
ncbi:hypothetical protein [Sulfobacillus thermosulfidooxidans]|uniref:hypothetical protein n=1 Tax=Sulfobacillus thermosulfidooxidans TaxID=28034 RepID=UPI0006B69A34|nr:hypothetical protein [Sulfobacillus thermosulfidooxidans]